MREMLDDLEERNPLLKPSWACPAGVGTEQPLKGHVAASFQSAAPASQCQRFEEMFHWASQKIWFPELPGSHLWQNRHLTLSGCHKESFLGGLFPVP